MKTTYQQAFIPVFVVILALFSGGCHKMKGYSKVTFKVNIEDGLRPGQEVYITGSSPHLGNWNPGKVPMKQQEDGTWTATFVFEDYEYLSYKFTKGKWENEAVDSLGYVPGDYQYQVTQDTVLNHTIYNFKDVEFNVRPIAGGITGRVDDLGKIEFEDLQPRKVLVWLPPGYEDNPKRNYPVLYMHDGQNVFDPRTSAATHKDWRVDEVADSLIRSGEMEPIIVVAAYCTDDRYAEYYFGAKGRTYARFLIEKLMPMINEDYRTKKGPENTAVMGSSMGGLVSFTIAWENPEVFGMAGCLSPAFQYQKNGTQIDYVAEVLAYDGPKKDLLLYIDNGTIGLESQLQPGVDAMMEALDDKGYDYVWFLDQGAQHNEAAWARRVHKPLLLFFGNEKL